MLNILIASARPQSLGLFAEALSAEPEVRLQWLGSAAEVLTAVRAAAPHLVVVDSTLPDAEPLGLIVELLKINAMVNSAVVSALSEKAFHDASEGLGVLGRVPDPPGRDDAVGLLEKLKRVLGMS